MDRYTTDAIERNRQALLGVVAILLSLGAKSGLLSPLWGVEPSACERSILPRILHRAALRILRPAEWAARRLVIALAQDLKPEPPKPTRPPKPFEASSFVRTPYQTGIYIPPETRTALRAAGYPDPKTAFSGRPAGNPVGLPDAPLRPIALPLFDPPLRNKRPKVAKAVPRISQPSIFDRPPPTKRRLPPRPHDALDATRLGLRIAGLSMALEDLPRQALRYARWREATAARPAVRTLRNGARQQRRTEPLRRWGLPGSKTAPEVHYILMLANGLALPAIQRHDTS